MTEAAISGGADAPADPIGAPIDVDTASHSQPLGTQIPPKEDKPEAEKPAATVREALTKANEQFKVKQAEKAKTTDAAPDAGKRSDTADAKDKAEVKPEQRARSEDGKFAPKEPAKDAKPADAPRAEQPATDPQAKPVPHREPPSRFSPDAKAAWEATHESVKAETHRAIRELEQGHQKYRADAEAYHDVREYGEMAKQSGTTLKAALEQYVGIEKLLRSDPMAGLERVVSNLGLRTPDGRPAMLQDIAAHILNQTPDQVAARQNSTIQQLNAKIDELERKLGSVDQTIQQQRAAAVEEKIAAFLETHPRFDELAEDISFFIQSGRAKELAEAYELAERLNPAPAQESAQTQPIRSATQQPDKPLNPAGLKSISGGPAPGSSPVQPTGPVPSIRDALQRAKRKAG